MAKINVSINKKIFTLACQDGDESRILLAAESFEKKLGELRKQSPSTSSDLLMAICILETQDQLTEALKKNQTSNDKVIHNNLNLFKNIKDASLRVQSLTKKIQDDILK
jgi:cell division protein ZapA (FtsZ GTPase activity inhibitor)